MRIALIERVLLASRRRFVVTLLVFSASLSFGAQERFSKLIVGDEVYRNVVVRSVNDSSLIISHSRGIASVALRDLSPEIQQQFEYNPDSDSAYQEELTRLRSNQAEEERERLDRIKERELSRSRKRSSDVSGPLVLEKEKDLRRRFASLKIGSTDQHARPSCAIHSVLGALEYELSRNESRSINLSESYVYWATLEAVGSKVSVGNDDDIERDAGFSLIEVFQAIDEYGLVEYEDAVDLRDRDPDRKMIEDARAWARANPKYLTGGNSDQGISNIIKALNADRPVVVGINWPYARQLQKTAVLDTQAPQPNYGHAVLIVGYKCSTGKLEDTTFIFRNSWGRRWGSGGYGFIRYAYMRSNLQAAFTVSVE